MSHPAKNCFLISTFPYLNTIWRTNSRANVHPFSLAPSFVALLAQEEVFGEDGNQKTPPGFLVMHLPFHDDIRDVPIDFPNVEIDEDQLNAAKAIIKKMKLRQFDTSAFENPALQSHYKLVEALALQKEDVEDLTFDR